jgi:hypothetical protein
MKITNRPTIQVDAADVRSHLSRLLTALRKAKNAEEAAQRGSETCSASMSLRKLHDAFVGTARKHCQAAIYRSVQAGSTLCSPTPQGQATIHCEHTIPVSIAVKQLWYLVKSECVDERIFLEFVLRNTIVTACTQKERRCSEGLALRRSYLHDTRLRAWSRHHPDLEPGSVWDAKQRPFLRYHGTSVAVIFVPTGQLICLERDTLQDHWDRISMLEAYQISNFYP